MRWVFCILGFLLAGGAAPYRLYADDQASSLANKHCALFELVKKVDNVEWRQRVSVLGPLLRCEPLSQEASTQSWAIVDTSKRELTIIYPVNRTFVQMAIPAQDQLAPLHGELAAQQAKVHRASASVPLGTPPPPPHTAPGEIRFERGLSNVGAPPPPRPPQSPGAGFGNRQFGAGDYLATLRGATSADKSPPMEPALPPRRPPLSLEKLDGPAKTLLGYEAKPYRIDLHIVDELLLWAIPHDESIPPFYLLEEFQGLSINGLDSTARWPELIRAAKLFPLRIIHQTLERPAGRADAPADPPVELCRYEVAVLEPPRPAKKSELELFAPPAGYLDMN